MGKCLNILCFDIVQFQYWLAHLVITGNGYYMQGAYWIDSFMIFNITILRNFTFLMCIVYYICISMFFD
jgi:hypothetical protein